MRKRLQDVFESRVWRGSDPGMRSGPGSSLEATERVRIELPAVLRRYDVTTLLDAPCGDWHWMRSVDLAGIDYIGGDISSEIVTANTASYGNSAVKFVLLDITSDPLPRADLMLCRDCLFHLKNRFRWHFFSNFASSDIPFLMMTMHHKPANRPLGANGNFAAFSPMAPPFDFPEPLEMVHEVEPSDGDPTRHPLENVKSLGIWPREAVAAVVSRAMSSSGASRT